jgi:opacity protein-like surface antigen
MTITPYFFLTVTLLQFFIVKPENQNLMKLILKTVSCLFVILGGINFKTDAQTNIPKFQFGAGIGTFVYMGDLTPSSLGSYKTLKPALNVFASKLFSPSFALRAGLTIGKLKGDDAKYDQPDYRQQRNFNFTSPVTEISGLAEWNILGRNYSGRGFSPYLFGGIGYSFLKIRRDWSNLNLLYFGTESELVTGLTTDAQQSLPKGLLVFPVGAGARYYLSDKIGISAETSYRLMSTDYLDGFSQAANPAKNDHYHSYTIGVVYRLGKKNTLDCPVIGY